jgi:hypothetical protein
MVRKVKRSLLAVCIAVAVIAMLVVPVSAVDPPVLPTKSPLPKGQPFETIWSLLVILQNQIKAIPAGPQGPTGPAGLSCWDLNADKICNNGEDKNGDGNCNALDCQGPKGDKGDEGDCGTGTCNVEIKTGEAADMEVVTVPDGFSTGQCTIVVSPQRMYCPSLEYLNGFLVRYTAMDDHQSYKIYAGGLCYQIGDSTPHVIDGEVSYVITCKS